MPATLPDVGFTDYRRARIPVARRPRDDERAHPVLRFLRLHALPAGAYLVPVVLDVAVITRGHTVLGLLTVSPLVAATLVRRRATAAYAVLALLTAALLGMWDRLYDGPDVLA